MDEPDAALRAMRKEKDEFFRRSPDSPVPPPERSGFEGLRYYEPDPRWRVRACWEPAERPRLVRVGTSTGEMRDYLEAGTLRFEAGGGEASLRGYVPPDAHAHELFVPFRDATSGKETYGAGRYLEVPLPHGADETVVDFNLAYNPWCAYSESYSCPLPPRENWLSVEVRAGEKAYKED